ncbi:MAG TPA: M20/M25/M40 family metallo-hydrolase [Candidatus Lokiarchaeia archaeon]|nr:M20/M25/M40 family metallo-hydrolase [Candidatus Lokiarchaeia archaeon]
MDDTSTELEGRLRDFITKVCQDIGPRSPCGPAEGACATYYESVLQDYCDEVATEQFFARPSAYKWSFRIPMILYLAAVAFYWWLPVASLVFAAAGFIIMIGEMMMMHEVIDFAFPKRPSVNVVGKIKSAGETKQVVVIEGHLDSNWEFPLMRLMGAAFTIVPGVNTFSAALLLLLSLVKSISVLASIDLGAVFAAVELGLFWVFVVAAPFAVIQLFFMLSNRPVMGANDNLSAMAVGKELAAFLSVPANRLANVEVWIVAVGCEEIGSKGSKAFAAAHRQELQGAKVFVVDMVGNKNAPLEVSKAEMVSAVKMSPELVQLVCTTAAELGIPVKVSSSAGFTDATSFRQVGIAATSILSMPTSRRTFYYHTRNDTLENMAFENLVSTYKICAALLKKLDES